MSFFYKETIKKSKKPASKQIPITTLQEHECALCPLDKKQDKIISPKMEPKGPAKTEVYILGGRPSVADDSKSSHFAGEVSGLIRSNIPSSWKRNVRYNYTMRCHNKSTLDKETVVFTECCRRSIERDIEETAPKVIFAIGIDALKWFGAKKADQHLWRGRMFPVKIGSHKCFVAPILDPLVVYNGQREDRRTKERKPGDFDQFLRSDIRDVLKKVEDDTLPTHKFYMEPEEREANIDWIYGKSAEDLQILEEWFDDLDGLHAVAIDLETSALRPYSDGRIITAAIGDDEFTFAFPISHRDGWRKHYPEGEARAKKLLYKFLMRKGTKIYHNGQFDLEWEAVLLGKDILRAEGVNQDCTQIQAYLLDSRKGMLNLDVLTFINFGFYLKDETGVNRGELEDEDYETVLKYNALDTKLTYHLWVNQTIEMSPHTKMQKLYRRRCRSMVMLDLCQIRGIVPDREQLAYYGKIYKSNIEDATHEINNLSEIKRFRRKKGKDFNAGSSHDVKYVLKDILNRPEGKKDDGKYATDESVLKAIPEKDTPIGKLLLKHRASSKMLSTYVDGITNAIHDDGLLHTSYLQTFTATGRLSSRDPNSQNFPKRKNKEIRNIVGAPEGFSITSNDYGQIEARVFAMASKDKEFTKALWENLDVHMDWALRLANAYDHVLDLVCEKYDMNRSTTPETKVIKTFRGDVKNQWVFPQFFGSAAVSCASNMGIPEDIAKKQAKVFWDMFDGVKKWQDKTVKFYKKNGYVETLTGLRRYGPINYNMQINTPIQGTASEIVCNAMCELSELAEREPDLWYMQPCLNIHDDITSYIPDDMMLDALKRSGEIMCNTPFDFVNVPLVAEMESGKTWGTQKALGEFFSNEGWHWNKGGALEWDKRADGFNEFCDQVEDLNEDAPVSIVLNDRSVANDLGQLHEDIEIFCTDSPAELFKTNKNSFTQSHMVVYDPSERFDQEDLVNLRNISKNFYHVPKAV